MQSQPTVTRVCQQCGKEFELRPWQLREQAGKFCGYPCYWQSKKGPKRSIAERFWEKVDRTTSPKGCWYWTGSHTGGGYGNIGTVGRGTALAHRLAWELTFGPIPCV